MAEEATTKQKPSFAESVKTIFFGNKLDAYAKEDIDRMREAVSRGASDIEAALSQLGQKDSKQADKLAASIEHLSGLSFEKFSTEKGSVGYVLVDTEGNKRGGAFPKKADALEDRIDGQTSVSGDSFISKKEALKMVESFKSSISTSNVSEELVNRIHNACTDMKDAVAVQKGVVEVSLQKSLTTVAVVALAAALLAGGLTAALVGSSNKQGDTQIITEYVEILKQESIYEKAQDLFKDSEGLIQDYGDVAQLIKAYKQEEWQEYKLAGKPTETEQGRIEIEKTLESRLQTQDSFRARSEEIEKGLADGTLSEREYTLEVLKLTRDVHQATALLKGDETVALEGVIDGLNTHYQEYYVKNNVPDDTHQTQIERYSDSKEAAFESIESHADMAEKYDYVISEYSANPDMSPEDASKLLDDVMKKGIPQEQSQAAEGGAVADDGPVQ